MQTAINGRRYFNRRALLKTMLIMKFTAILLLVACLQVSAEGFGQKVTLSEKNAPLKKVFKEIKKQTGYSFFFDEAWIKKTGTVSITVKEMLLEKVLDICFKDQSLSYSIVGNTIVLKQRINAEIKKSKFTPAAEIPGVVTGENDTPLQGVTVTVKGTTKSTSTNSKGEYKIDVNVGDVLEFSSVGYKTTTMIVGTETVLNMKLEVSAAELGDVVVIGYGTQKKKSVVSAISTVKGEQIKFPGRNLTTNIAGQVAGLISVQRSGEPGYDNAEFWIRGISTFKGGTSPLVLVDGVPRRINDIEPDEIETFSVLKDAAATAVYGAEGANGVVLITSKRGSSKKPVISFRAEHTVSTPMRMPKFVSSADYLKLYNEALNNDGLSSIFSDSLIQLYRSNVDPDLYPNTDWIKAMVRDNTKNDRFTLNVRGGSDRAKYFVSGAYYSENGIFKDDPANKYNNNIGLKRFNLRSNIDLEVSKTTTVSVDLAGQYLLTNYPGVATSNIFRQMVLTPSYAFPAVYSDGTIATYFQERDANMRNPYNLLVNSGYSKEWRSNIQSAVRLNQKLDFITRGLSYKALVSYDYDGYFSSNRTYNPSRYNATGRDANGKLIFSRTFAGTPDLSSPTTGNNAQKKVYIENSLNYNRAFNKHAVGAMVLYMQKEQQNHDNALAFRKQSVVGRATYAFDNRYFVEGSFGYTGSETFAPGYRFGLFPAVGVGYMVSNESFYPAGLKDILSTFKLRASVGRTGNDNTGTSRFLYRPTFNFGAGGFNQGITSGGPTNGYGNGITEGLFEAPYLSWEIEDKQNYGVNLGFFNDKIQFVGDYFKNERSDILLQRNTVPGSSGFRTAPWQNYGRVKSWGFDGSLDGSHTFGKDLTLGFRSTFTYATNKITEYDELTPKFPYQAITGTSVSENTLYIANGLYTESDFDVTQNTNGTRSYTLKPGLPVPTLGGLLGPGDIKYVDLNGDGKIDQFDAKRGVGNPFNPEIVYGFGVNAQYKGFYASVFFQGVGKTSVVLGAGTPQGFIPFLWGGGDQSNYRSFALDRWTEADKNSSQVTRLIPRLHTRTNNNNNVVASTWWLRDASFLRLKNMEIGYNFPVALLQKLHLKTARVYLMGYNLALWDKIKYWDPETGNGTAGNAYPNSRSFTIGIETSF
ncbi:TonB-dependent receptor [Ferruginibacter sp.]|nr:TonB-dependent receptor [Ferruginibacter sp.]